MMLLSLTVKKGGESSPRRLPPGPPGLPIFGNLFSLGDKPHITLSELAKTYGPLMTLQLGRVPTVVISSAAMAKETLQKNDLSFSRNAVDAVHALNHHEESVVWLPAGSKWRKLRKICNTHIFSTSKLDAGQSLRRTKVSDLLAHVEKMSEAGTAVDIGLAAFTTTLNLLSNTFFSVDLSDPNSEFASKFKKNTREMIHVLSKPNFADYFPLLRKIDPQGIRQGTSVHFGKIMDAFKTVIEQRLQGGKSPPGSIQGTDVLDSLFGIDKPKTEDIEPSEFYHLLLDLFGGGVDTTSSTLEWAMAELLHNPEKLKRVKQELEAIIGKENLVEEHDVARLPYLQAVVKETLRLHPPLPLLVPRKVESDVKLFEFTVPKNAQVLVNAWAIGRDPKTWENPNSFEPERFLGSDVDVKGHDFELIPFGAGRRICPGLPLAIRMLHLMLGSLLHGFNWMLEGGISPEDMNMEDKFGISVEKAQRLRAIPVRV